MKTTLYILFICLLASCSKTSETNNLIHQNNEEVALLAVRSGDK